MTTQEKVNECVAVFLRLVGVKPTNSQAKNWLERKYPNQTFNIGTVTSALSRFRLREKTDARERVHGDAPAEQDQSLPEGYAEGGD